MAEGVRVCVCTYLFSAATANATEIDFPHQRVCGCRHRPEASGGGPRPGLHPQGRRPSPRRAYALRRPDRGLERLHRCLPGRQAAYCRAAASHCRAVALHGHRSSPCSRAFPLRWARWLRRAAERGSRCWPSSLGARPAACRMREAANSRLESGAASKHVHPQAVRSTHCTGAVQSGLR